MSLAQSVPETVAIEAGLTRLLGQPTISLERLHGGGNGRVFKAMFDDGRTFAVKQYFVHPADPRDRLGNEFRALELLRARGFPQVPAPITMEPALSLGVYEFVEGSRIPSERVTEADIEDLCEFLSRLRGLGSDTERSTLPDASEASFCLAQILRDIERRRRRLAQVPGGAGGSGELQGFLAQEFDPAFRAFAKASRAAVERAGHSASRPLPVAERTLSPSDFGFHNALRTPDGRIVYLDFEYFGWDDPAKATCDFLLHPRSDLALSLRRRFVGSILQRFPHAKALDARVRAYYPLFGLKWCMILLNEFVPETLARRSFAAHGPGAIDEVQRVQLAKARSLLARLMAEAQSWPYT